MRGKFGIERCCCDCVRCDNCIGGEASRKMWVHLLQGNDDRYQGHFLLTSTIPCRWESGDTYLPKRVTLQVNQDSAQLQVSNDDHPGTVALWDFTVDQIGDDVNCDEWAAGTWTCREDTGTLPCSPADELEIQPFLEVDIEGEDLPGQPVTITDDAGNVIEGVFGQYCSPSIPCSHCQGGVGPKIFFLEVEDIFADDPTGDWSVLNTTHELEFLIDDQVTGFACVWSATQVVPNYNNPAYPGQTEYRVTITLEIYPPTSGIAPSVWFRTDPDNPPAPAFLQEPFPADCFQFDREQFLDAIGQPMTMYLSSNPPGGVTLSSGSTRGRVVECPKCGHESARTYTLCRRTGDRMVRCKACGLKMVVTGA